MIYVLTIIFSLTVLILNLLNLLILLKKGKPERYAFHVAVPSLLIATFGILLLFILKNSTYSLTMFISLYLYMITALMNVLVGSICLIKCLIYKDTSYLVENIAFIVLSVIALNIAITITLLTFALYLPCKKSEERHKHRTKSLLIITSKEKK